MLNGLDLFSGIGGLSIALSEWVKPIAYCEIDPYCQGVLLSRMASGHITKGPIWNDVRILPGKCFRRQVDIIYGGFPCQDISVAGHGKGLEGERSGLFFEIVRLAKEIQPKFLFLENVVAITSRGGLRVIREITEMGYDCRWCVLSAASVGAPHRRERWFLLAYAKHFGRNGSEIDRSTATSISDSPEGKDSTMQSKGMDSSRNVADSKSSNDREYSSESMQRQEPKFRSNNLSSNVANTGFICERCIQESGKEEGSSFHDPRCSRFWEIEPCVGRVVDELPFRMDRIRGLGNAVVPKQAKEAFKILMGLK